MKALDLKPIHNASRRLQATRLLVFPRPDAIRHTTVAHFAEFLESGDLLVVNQSATLPASFQGTIRRTGEQLEIRLAAFQGPDASDLRHWYAIAFGSGNWRQPTEQRGSAPSLIAGDWIQISADLSAEVLSVESERILEIRWQSSDLLTALYQAGQPIQYAYHQEPLAVWDQQTLFAGAPISVEPPSAAFPFSWELMLQLRAKGVQVTSLLHSAGLSSTGDPKLDQQLPLPEWYEIPAATVAAIKATQARGQRIIALGTTVLRALESAASTDSLSSGRGLAQLKILPGYRFQVVNALISGMHEPDSSHMLILDALCPYNLIRQGYMEASQQGYLGHEYGDLSFLNCQAC